MYCENQALRKKGVINNVSIEEGNYPKNYKVIMADLDDSMLNLNDNNIDNIKDKIFNILKEMSINVYVVLSIDHASVFNPTDEWFFKYIKVTYLNEFKDKYDICIAYRKDRSIYDIVKNLYMDKPNYRSDVNHVVVPWIEDFESITKDRFLSLANSDYFNNMCFNPNDHYRETFLSCTNEQKWWIYRDKAKTAAFYEMHIIEHEIELEKEREKEIEEEKRRQEEIYRNSQEYKDKVKEEYMNVFNPCTNKILKLVEEGEKSRILVQKYFTNDYQELNDFYGLINTDKFNMAYDRYVNFYNNAMVILLGALVLTIVLLAGIDATSSIMSWFGCIIPIVLFIIYYYRGMEDRYKLGWIIYLRNNWFNYADLSQKAVILSYIMMVGTAQDTKKYMVHNISERYGINPHPPNSLDEVNFNRILWKKINNKEVKI